MPIGHLRSAAIGAAALLVCLTTFAANATPPDATVEPHQVVSRDNQKSWKIDQFNGTVTFDPAVGCNAPSVRGDGALHLRVNPGDGWARLRNEQYNNAPLAELVALDYWACDNNNNGQQWPFILLNVDWNSDHETDDFIFFEPAYQNPVDGGACGLASAQPSPVLHTWQRWDALRGTNGADADACWWSVADPAFQPGFIIRPLRDYVAAHPGATIVNPSGNAGGVQIAHGFASPSDEFDGYLDEFRIATINPASAVTYDYEP